MWFHKNEFDMINSTRKPVFIFLFLLLIGFGYVGLAYLFSFMLPILGLIVASIPGAHPIAAPKEFPNTDIIYVGGKGLGFINADGSKQESFRFQALRHSALDESKETFIMTGDYETFITVNTGYGTYEGSVYMAYPGEIAMDCGWHGVIQLAPDQKHILVGTEHGHDKYLLTDCGTGNNPERTISDFNGVLSPDEQHSVETQYLSGNKSDLILHSLRTGEKRIFENGRFPAWSRDSHWLAYTGADGIYIIENSPNTEPRRLVYIEQLSVNIPLYAHGRYPPAVSWSPDGQWLVYHMSNDGDYPFSIFKVNLKTGETIKLLEDGMFPYWIWPAEKP